MFWTEALAPIGLRRLAARAGARLALIQALVVVTAFAIAGVMTQMAVDRLETSALRERVQGEAGSLSEEFAQRGASHLPHTIAKRTRQWRGFAYRLEGPDGALQAGLLPRPPRGDWSELAGAPAARDVARRPYLVLRRLLPDGSSLSVGQDLSARVNQSAALTRTLWLCGACGVAFCVAASTAFTGRTWRRVAAVTAAARAVHDGKLDVRVPVNAGPARDDLDDLARAFNAMMERIGTLIEQVRQVSTDIAHDLRTPLTRVRQRLERLRADAEHDPELAAGVQRIDDDLSEILRTFDALLQLAEIGVRDVSRDRPFDLAEVAVRVGEAFRPDIEDGGRRLDLHVAPAAVRGDAQLVAQAVANLLENAVRHCPPGTRVMLRVSGGDDPVLLVTDDGPGIPFEHRKAVLRPLVRLESSRKTAGSGLGLSVVAAVAARHDAELDLQDAAPGLAVRLRFRGLQQEPA